MKGRCEVYSSRTAVSPRSPSPPSGTRLCRTLGEGGGEKGEMEGVDTVLTRCCSTHVFHHPRNDVQTHRHTDTHSHMIPSPIRFVNRYAMAPALSAYESQRCTGTSSGNDEFKQAVKRLVPEGHSFNGFPLLVHSTSPTTVSLCWGGGERGGRAGGREREAPPQEFSLACTCPPTHRIVLYLTSTPPSTFPTSSTSSTSSTPSTSPPYYVTMSPLHRVTASPLRRSALPAQVWRTLMASRQCKPIIDARGDECSFALRVRCFVYPEDVVAVWCMLAVRFHRPPAAAVRS